MIKETITYEDFNGTERTEDFYFNLSKAELIEMELSTDGGFSNYINKITAAKDTKTLIMLFKKIILSSYGEKSLDGKRFIKSEEISKAFQETEAFSILFHKLAVDDGAAANFVNGLIPASLSKEISKEI